MAVAGSLRTDVLGIYFTQADTQNRCSIGSTPTRGEGSGTHEDSRPHWGHAGALGRLGRAGDRFGEADLCNLKAEGKTAFARYAPEKEFRLVRDFDPVADEILWVRPLQGG